MTLLKKGVEWKWDDEEQDAFDKVKNMLALIIIHRAKGLSINTWESVVWIEDEGKPTRWLKPDQCEHKLHGNQWAVVEKGGDSYRCLRKWPKVPWAKDRKLECTIREVAQKPHEPHAAFVHCAKPHRKKDSEVSQAAKSVRNCKTCWGGITGRYILFCSVMPIRTETVQGEMVKTIKIVHFWGKKRHAP
ncbi:hypothetical protein DFH08DRAFT_823444 [Mycena albidolilacea]|uniref:Uncharacterized protein n=1 Tax=Mycena albidolilacea TaxID=1033008 RepID=A0AAD6Z5V1_9AGAR|nr:hypothetical protein DFH08DRAFT_823444 [Mycena albidolilacea]